MSTFPNMVDIVADNAMVGIAKTTHYDVTKFEAMMSSIRGIATSPRKLAQLHVGGRLMMTDADFEHRTNYDVVRYAKGNVLIAGLGLGMILHPIQAKKDVKAVTVVEKYDDVVKLISPTLPTKKMTFVVADIFDWRPTKGARYDCIYFDIWPDICTDNLAQIAKLHQRFKGYKVSGGWMDSWCSDYLRDRKRRGM